MTTDEPPDQGMRRTAGDHPALTESYLLGELDEAQRAAFETHMFDCSACAADVVATADFLGAARAVIARDVRSAIRIPQTRMGRWKRGLATLTVASAISAVPLLGVVAYQAVVGIPHLRSEIALRDRPRALVATALRPQTRGQLPEVLVGAAEPFFTVVLDLAVPVGISALEGELQGDKGETVLSRFAIALPPPGEPVQLLLPASAVRDGQQILTIRGPGGEQIERFTFRVAKAR
jgi:hypothetical protein